MTKEQEKAIQELYHLAHINTYLDLQVKSVVKISTEIIEKWKNATNLALNLIQTQKEENKKKDKIIKLEANYIITHTQLEDMKKIFCQNCTKCKGMVLDCIKQYFERKIENESNK